MVLRAMGAGRSGDSPNSEPRSPGVGTWLKDWAACAEEVTVRRAAVEGLAHGWKDDPSPEKQAGQPLTLIVNWPALMKQGAAAQ